MFNRGAYTTIGDVHVLYGNFSDFVHRLNGAYKRTYIHTHTGTCNMLHCGQVHHYGTP